MSSRSQCKPPTKKELAWIEEFEKLCKKIPKKLWLFAGDGTMCIMKTPEDDNDNDENGYVNQDNIITRVFGLRCDGGAW